MCHHVKFGSSETVYAKKKEPQNWEVREPRPLAVWAWLTRRNMPLPHIYVILPNLVVLRPTVRALLSAGNNLTLCVLSMSLKVIGTDRDHGSISYDFLLTFCSNHKPISYCFHDKRRFRSKIAFFPTPMYLTPPLEGIHLGTGAGSQKKLE